MELKFILNGKKTACSISPDTTLLQLLRSLGCYSVRSGCDTENCGICTVWVDDTPILSCSYPAAKAEGCSVTTVEGVIDEANELVSFMANEGADQCGYCSPGFIMTVLALKRENPHPTADEIKQYLAGNLCRCTGYASHMRMLTSYFEEAAE